MKSSRSPKAEQRKVNNRTRNNYLIHLKALFSELIKREIISKHPAQHVKLLRTTGASNILYSKEQQATIETWLKKHDPDLYIFTKFIYYAFLRPIEILRLRPRDIVGNMIIVKAKGSKNAKQLPVTIVKPLARIIEGMELHKLDQGCLIFGKKLEPLRLPKMDAKAYEKNREVVELE